MRSGLRPGAGLAWVAAALVAAILFLVLAGLMPISTQDDAFITFRFARNMARGLGPVYNPGEPVEGYTNFLWMILMAGVIAGGGNPVVWAAYLGMACGAALTVLVAWMGARLYRHHPALVGIGPLLLVLLPGFLEEAVEGLETVCFALLVTAGLGLAAARAERGAGFPWHAPVLALAALTRPEGALVFAVVEVGLALHRWRTGEPWLTPLARNLAGFLALFAPYYAWRFSYYGYPFPNTFYAKTGDGVEQVVRGAGYVGSFFAALGFAPLPLAALLALRRNRRLPVLLALGLAAVYLAYVASVGGDFKRSYRYILPVFALLCLIWQTAWDDVLTVARRRGARLAVAAAALAWISTAGLGVLAWQAGGLGARIARRHEPNAFLERSRIVGDWIRRQARAGDRLAIAAAGALAYHADIPVIDMWGLTDLHIARQKPPEGRSAPPGHRRGDGKYVLARRPRFILFQPKLQPRPFRPDEIEIHSVSGMQIRTSPEFDRDYELHLFQVEGMYSYVYRRRSGT